MHDIVFLTSRLGLLVYLPSIIKGLLLAYSTDRRKAFVKILLMVQPICGIVCFNFHGQDPPWDCDTHVDPLKATAYFACFWISLPRSGMASNISITSP